MNICKNRKRNNSKKDMIMNWLHKFKWKIDWLTKVY